MVPGKVSSGGQGYVIGKVSAVASGRILEIWGITVKVYSRYRESFGALDENGQDYRGILAMETGSYVLQYEKLQDMAKR